MDYITSKWLARHDPAHVTVLPDPRLVDAAPDMLAALLPLSFCDPETPPHGVAVADWKPAILAARAAVLKARGRS
jgi:hypothetical protein